jgi:hypothetical protein
MFKLSIIQEAIDEKNEKGETMIIWAALANRRDQRRRLSS